MTPTTLAYCQARDPSYSAVIVDGGIVTKLTSFCENNTSRFVNGKCTCKERAGIRRKATNDSKAESYLQR